MYFPTFSQKKNNKSLILNDAFCLSNYCSSSIMTGISTFVYIQCVLSESCTDMAGWILKKTEFDCASDYLLALCISHFVKGHEYFILTLHPLVFSEKDPVRNDSLTALCVSPYIPRAVQTRHYVTLVFQVPENT